MLEHLWLDYCNCSNDNSDACQKELSSLIDRSSCRIRQLTLECFFGKVARRIMKTLANVEEFYIKHLVLHPRIVRKIAYSFYMPKIRVLQVNCCPGYRSGFIPSPGSAEQGINNTFCLGYCAARETNDPSGLGEIIATAAVWGSLEPDSAIHCKRWPVGHPSLSRMFMVIKAKGRVLPLP